jgi:hypothetical protein
MAIPTEIECAKPAPARLTYRCRAALYTIPCGISTTALDEELGPGFRFAHPGNGHIAVFLR